MKLFEEIKKRKLSQAELSEFCGHVGAMLHAGIPLAEAMEILQSGAENRKMKTLYQSMEQNMQKGHAFSKAAKETEMFPELLLHMFYAAETGGRLEETADRMAIYYKKEHQNKNQIRQAKLYPKLLCLMSIVCVLVVFLVVVPTVEPLFRGMELPLLTRILFGISEVLEHYGCMCLALFVLGYHLFRMLFRQAPVVMLLDRIKVSIPIIGTHFRVIYTSRFARSESGLYESGLPIVEGLEIASKTIGNYYIEAQFPHVMELVRGGEALSSAIKSVKGFDKKLAAVMYVGEETGKMDEMLERIAENYEHDAEMAITRLIAMIEPGMMIVMGFVIAVLMLGIMMPMWSMYGYMM